VAQVVAGFARVGIDLDPVDVTNAEDARWSRTCVWPDRAERRSLPH
jgi:hypothetical protein